MTKYRAPPLHFSIGARYPYPLPAEPCECVTRMMRAVRDGKAACSKHKIFAEKIDGKLRASKSQTLVVVPIRAGANRALRSLTLSE